MLTTIEKDVRKIDFPELHRRLGSFSEGFLNSELTEAQDSKLKSQLHMLKPVVGHLLIGNFKMMIDEILIDMDEIRNPDDIPGFRN
jgi:hypothetical protein